MRLLTCALALIILPLGAAEELLSDQWFSGTVGQHRAISAHEVVRRQGDSQIASRFTMQMRLERVLGAAAAAMAMQQDRRYTEAADGSLVGFQFDDEMAGSRSSASGTVTDGIIRATVLHAGATRQQDLSIPDGATLRGYHAGQRQLASAELAVGEQLEQMGIELIGGKLTLVTTTATLLAEEADGSRRFQLVMNLNPTPVQATISPDGGLRRMQMQLGPLAIVITPSNGPQPLQAARIDAAALIAGDGTAPPARAQLRYRIPADRLAQLPETAFQELQDGLLLVRSVGDAPAPDADTTAQLLAAEAHLQTGDAAIRQWVEQQLAAPADASTDQRAELLRLAVRGHLTRKDLTQADASASECFASRTGDCTEHANLLVTALRIANIPARREIGLVYSGELGAWVGHAWVSAWDDDADCWIHLDAAYPGILRSHYLTTALGSGADGIAGLLAGAITLLGSEINVVEE